MKCAICKERKLTERTERFPELLRQARRRMTSIDLTSPKLNGESFLAHPTCLSSLFIRIDKKEKRR